MQSILTTTKEQEQMELFGIKFNETVSRTYRKGQENEKTFTYNASALTDDGIFAIISRDDRKDEDDYRGTVELRVSNAEGKDVGISATIYGPNIRWQDEIEDAQVNWSAIGSTSAAITRASSGLLVLASIIAERWTEQELPRLRKEQEARKAARAAAQAEREREQAAKKAWVANVVQQFGKDSVVRVKMNDRKGFVIGTLGSETASYILVHRNGKVEKLPVSKIEFVEGKDIITGKYGNRIDTEAI